MTLSRYAIIVLAFLGLATAPALAHGRHHHPVRHHHHRAARAAAAQPQEWGMWNWGNIPVVSAAANVGAAVARGGIVMVQTAAGIPIQVASSLSGRFRRLVAEFVAAGYRPRHIGCFARSGHVHNSRHYAGAACDFDQRGWGKTVGFMYTATAHQLIVSNGFRDGREFGDTGHVDDGRSVGSHHRHYAYRSRRRYAGR
jgi:hypothetical protein